MKPGLRTFAVGFFVGLLVGGLAARIVGPHFGRRPLSPEKRQERMLKRLTSELRLDNDQQKAIDGLLQEGRHKMDDLMSPVRPHFDEVRKDVNAKIRALLNPDQQKKFDAFNEKIEKHWHEHGENPPSEPTPGH